MQTLFQKNLKYFYENLPQYYNLIKNLKHRNYIIKNDNLFDKNNNKLYPNSIEEDSKTFAFFPTHNDLWEKRFFYITPEKWQKEFQITGKIVNKIIKKAKTLKSYTKGFYFDKNFLPTTIIFGLLAGKHLDILVENYEFQSLFVYEPNPEFFAISLYFVDYEKIYKKLGERFFLWVNGKVDYFAIEKFYFERRITSSFLNLTLTTYNHPLIEDAKSKFEEIGSAKLRGWGTYEDEMKGVKNHLQNINKYPTLTKSKNLNIPVCVVANGKSLEKNIEFIKKNKNSMIIISVGTAIKPLLNAGIESDFHIEQERIDLLKDVLKDILPNYNGYFVGANVVNPLLFKMAKKPLMYIREGFTLSTNPLIGSSPIVGNSGVAFAKTFSNEIYLCGMDLGFRLGEKKHSKNSFYDDSAEDVATDGIKSEANFGGEIHSDSLLLQSKDSIEKLIAKYNLKVYNLSDGVKIAGAEPTEGDIELPEINEQQYIEEILKLFTETDFNAEDPKLDVLIDIFIRNFDKSINSYYDLDNLVDDTRNALYDFAFKNNMKSELAMMRGTLQHVLLFFYAYAHRIHFNKIKDLQQLVIRQLERINW